MSSLKRSQTPLTKMDGALLIDKHAGVTSFGIIEQLQRLLMESMKLKKKELPKLGHGGTLDPFATGLLVVLVGRGAQLARYFLGSSKAYEGRIRFGETSTTGDPTGPISETTEILPTRIEELQRLATQMASEPYFQTPPMFSAKKRDGKPLYQLARLGLEVKRESKLCQLYQFTIQDYHPPHSNIVVQCSSGTYIRTLAQDFAKKLGSLALLENLHRTQSGIFHIQRGLKLEGLEKAMREGKSWDQLSSWIPFNQLLQDFPSALATPQECKSLIQGQQQVLENIVKRVQFPHSEKEDFLTIFSEQNLLAVARKNQNSWSLERVFC